MPRDGHLDYPRHFVLLACAVGLLAAGREWLPPLGLLPSFGLYGGLHAALLLVTRRTRAAWRAGSGWRANLLFVGSAAALSASSAAFGWYGSRYVGGLPGAVGIGSLVALSSGGGAAGYSLLLRRLTIVPLSNRAIGSVTIGCVLATLLALACELLLESASTLWLAMVWWFALSAGVCWQDRS